MNDDATDPGREKRSGVIIRAVIDFGDWKVEKRVRNLSEHGACVDNGGELTEAQRVHVSMGRLDDLTATVMWTRDNLAGLRFDQPVDLTAARAPRGAGTVQAGWMKDMYHAYRQKR